MLFETDVSQNLKSSLGIVTHNNSLTLRHRFAGQCSDVDLVSYQDQVALSRKRFDLFEHRLRLFIAG